MPQTLVTAPFAFEKHPWDAKFDEGLEAAGYCQKLDVSEERITARYQHALTKMQYARHSEEFLTRMGVRKVHCSTVQFFNETPVSDPFVHVQVGSLPRRRQKMVQPAGADYESVWTPIGSPDEADGTCHFTVSFDGFWPITVVFDVNKSHLAHEDDFARLDEDSAYGSNEDQVTYTRSRRGSTLARRSNYEISSASEDEGYYGGSRSASASGRRRRARSIGGGFSGDEGYTSARSARSLGGFSNRSGRQSRFAELNEDSDSGLDGAYAGTGRRSRANSVRSHRSRRSAF